MCVEIGEAWGMGSSSLPAMSAGSRCAHPATSTSARTASKRACSARPSTSATRGALRYAMSKVRMLMLTMGVTTTTQHLATKIRSRKLLRECSPGA
uniref:Cesa5 n=1 Tax=Arundo donax TaxID=35708 RepID=A0A0A9GJZ3_ARUDO